MGLGEAARPRLLADEDLALSAELCCAHLLADRVDDVSAAARLPVEERLEQVIEGFGNVVVAVGELGDQVVAQVEPLLEA